MWLFVFFSVGGEYTQCVLHNNMAKSLFKDKPKSCQFKSVPLLSYLNYHTSVWASALKCVTLDNAV